MTVQLQAVRFDADVLISDAVVGVANGFVRSVDQVGYVQIAPEAPLTPEQYGAVLAAEGPMGGPVDCVVDIGRSGQKMRVSRVDVAAAPVGIGRDRVRCRRPRLPASSQRRAVELRAATRRRCALNASPADPHTGVPLVRQGHSTVADALNHCTLPAG